MFFSSFMDIKNIKAPLEYVGLFYKKLEKNF